MKMNTYTHRIKYQRAKMQPPIVGFLNLILMNADHNCSEKFQLIVSNVRLTIDYRGFEKGENIILFH